MLASSIHDMKNSLGLVMHELENIGYQLQDDKEKSSAISSLRYEASRINTSLMELLALYKMENQQLSIHTEEAYIIDLLDDVIAAHAFLAQSKTISLEVDCDEELMWFVDTNLMRIVLNNIVSNSIRYSHSKVLITASIKKQHLLLAIEDDGEGYPESMIKATKHIKQEIDVDTGSTGLGLYFASIIADSHQKKGQKGTVSLLNNQTLNGGCFQIAIP